RAKDVAKLKESITGEHKNLLDFAAAIKSLDTLLKTEAKGYSLHSIYAKIPEILKGYVEIVYDLNNNPSIKFFESLLYKSEFYKESLQSIALWITNDDERPFVLSTPRLDDDHVVHLPIPFKHGLIDLLGEMKRKGKPYHE